MCCIGYLLSCPSHSQCGSQDGCGTSWGIGFILAASGSCVVCLPRNPWCNIYKINVAYLLFSGPLLYRCLLTLGVFCYVQELAFQIPLYCFFLIHIYVFVCSCFLSRVWNMLFTTLVASMLFPRYMTFDSLVHSLVYKQSEVDWLTAHHKAWVKLYKYWPSNGYKMILNRNHLNRRANQASTDSGWMDLFGSHNRWYDELSNILFFSSD